MKSKIKILAICLSLLAFSVLFARQVSAQQSEVSFQVFYDQLSPYGQWVDYPNYGYVWIPDAGSDFVPYSTKGHWIMTDDGMTWVSDYNWGWAPFHYGRWDYDNSYGWFWIPGNEWGPAWVSWRRASGYYGWEPMGPGVSISMSFGREYDSHNDHWVFVQDRYIDRSDMNRFYANRVDHDRIIRNSTIINNTYVDSGRHTTYASGPSRDDIQKSTGRKVTSVPVQENIKPGQKMSNGHFMIYRPQVITNDKQQKPVPTRLTNIKDVKQPQQNNSANKTGNNQKVQQPSAANQQNAANQRNAANQQDAKYQQNAVNRRNAANQQKVANQPKAASQKNTVAQQNQANQQNAANQPKVTNQQNTSNQKNQVQNTQGTQNTRKGIVSRIFGKKTTTTSTTTTKPKTDTQQENKKKE